MTAENSPDKINILGPDVVSASDAKNILSNYHNGHIELTPDQYVALYKLLCTDRASADPNPKKKARQRGQRIRKKRTGSRRG